MNMDVNYETAFVQELLSKTWPTWQISRKLGKGSYGSVYEIERNDLGTRYTCALKVLHLEAESTDTGGSVTNLHAASPGAQDSPTVFLFDRVSDTEIAEFVQGVSSEINLMMQLKGVPNIVTIEDYAVLRYEHRCTILIRMEELEPLAACLARRGGSFDKEELIRLGTEICSALTFCEHKNILHRDIKPGNLFYSPEAGYKLGDFGISRTMASIREKASMSGIGTLQYMAPEIYQGRKYNNTADIYSLGIVLYILANDMLPPFCDVTPGHTASDLSSSLLHDANMRRLRGEPLTGPRNADERLASVICTACNPVPEYRFQTAEAFRNALLGCLDSASAPTDTQTDLPAGTENGEVPSESSDPQPIVWSDPNLQDAVEPKVQALLGIDSPITLADARKVEELDLTGAGISDITSLQHFIGLTKLCLCDNTVSDLAPLAGLTKLEDLNLEKNLVSDLSPLSGLVRLKRLDLYSNNIHEITPLAGLTKLTMLDIRSNSISDISAVDSLPALTYLDIRKCPIKDVGPANRAKSRNGCKVDQ